MENVMDKKIEEFYNACTDMTNAKLILADSKIGKILKCITSSSELISAVGETLINFNFESEFSKAQVKNELKTLYFKLPEEKTRLVALVYNILSAIDTHQLDLHSFIRDFFINEIGDLSYGFTNFVYTMIFPFRDALCEMVGCGENKTEAYETENQTEEESEESVEEQGVFVEFFDDLSTILTQIKEVVNVDPKVKEDRKCDINITIEALLTSIDICNLKILNALLISLNNLIAPIKSVRLYNQELQERLVRFYGELEED